MKATPTVLDPAGFELPPDQKAALRWTIYIGYFALTAGIFHGLAQALSYANIDILRFFPGLKGYYQGLTAHGVANALIFTFAFSNGFLPLMTARALGRPLVGWLVHAALATLVIGNVLVIYAVTTNQASVLFTAYAPLQAHWTFYFGLVLVVVSTWLALVNMLVVLRGWRREHLGDHRWITPRKLRHPPEQSAPAARAAADLEGGDDGKGRGETREHDAEGQHRVHGLHALRDAGVGVLMMEAGRNRQDPEEDEHDARIRIADEPAARLRGNQRIP